MNENELDKAHRERIKSYQMVDSFSREEYEKKCQEENVGCLSDEDILDHYGIRYGSFWVDAYSSDDCVKMNLGRLRQKRLDLEKSEVKKAPEKEEIKKQGEIWESCSCGCEPVYSPLMLCDKCWPK